jgi:hypothetical protein
MFEPFCPPEVSSCRRLGARSAGPPREKKRAPREAHFSWGYVRISAQEPNNPSIAGSLRGRKSLFDESSKQGGS